MNPDAPSPTSPASHPAEPPTDGAPTPSRRELNRLATQAAIVSATLTLAEDHAWNAVTVDRVAEAAGVSRRTFFNYFGSLEDALHQPLRDLVAAAARRMDERKDAAVAGESVIGLLADTLAEVITLDLLAPTARVLLLVRDHPGLRDAGLRTWDDCVRALVPAPGEGSPAARLYVSTLVRAAVAAAQAAFETWAETLTSPLHDDDVAALRSRLAEAMGLLRDGFALPGWVSEDELAACPPAPTALSPLR